MPRNDGMLLVRAVYRQLGGEPAYAAQVVAAIAAGDLGVTVATRPGDHGSLQHAMTAMQQMLAKTVGNIRMRLGGILSRACCV